MTREGAKKYLEMIKVFAEGKTIQYYSGLSEKWLDLANPEFSINVEYRLKPEPKAVPFNMETIKPYRDKWFKNKYSKSYVRILDFNDTWINVDGPFKITYAQFLEAYTFEDGSPCGIEQEC